ncbi:hypothetical protein B0I35DRAFT_425669 [Stachybotrys elegans]|uniref:MI domain-containing protein n=1 Tax=Stachybotrys elegans TaxID=80388 RepID=A0A8K0T074_9HYPO|nr:hypothetical protein B0I35DRAFT_425669 [Stachybotrys elegans]
MPSTSVAELQQKLYKRMGLDIPQPSQGRASKGTQRKYQPLSRKDQRKAHRVQKRAHIYSKTTEAQDSTRRPSHRVQGKSKPRQTSKPANTSGLRNKNKDEALEESSEDEDELDEDMLDLDEEEDDDDEEEGNAIAPHTDSKQSSKQGAVSRTTRDRLAQDDAEIEELERKLGIKKGRKSLPQAFKDDGLDELLGDLGGEEEASDDQSNQAEREYEEWLSSKRSKSNSSASYKAPRAQREDDEGESGLDSEEEDDDMLDYEDDDLEGGNSDEDAESFDGFESDVVEKTEDKPRQKENPYVAPSSGVVIAKYVPPSLRKATGSEGEAKLRLRKQVQGLVNRLTDANILSIVQSVEDLYQKNARGDVTEILTDSVLAQICKPESLPDQFFVLTGGFIAAAYKVIGSSFGSHFINRVVTDFGQEYERAIKSKDQSGSIKETSNLMTLLSQLYTFEVVTCKIIFDYMERLLEELNELNVELLLRICRMAGRLLRRDDSQTLKHVSGILNKQVSQLGMNNISVRTKFMVETINDLKNSKPKAKGMDSAVVSEHVSRMKKRLGELKSQTRRLEGLAPMGMSLDDIESAGTRGKWWLVGASVPVKPSEKRSDERGGVDGTDGDDFSTDDEDMDFVLPDYPQKARAQGFSTSTQIAIFTALMSAINYEQGFQQVMQLGLKKDEQLEIAKVLVQCVGSEAVYNEYYALVAKQACSNGRIRFAFQDRLWRIFRGLGESLFGEEPEDDETADGERMKDERRMSNVARFYAALIADGALSLTLLKPLDLPEVNPFTSTFIEWLMISLLQLCKSKGAEEDARLDRAFGTARDLPALAAGLHWTLRKKVRKSKLISAKELKKLERVREKAQVIVQMVSTEE